MVVGTKQILGPAERVEEMLENLQIFLPVLLKAVQE